MTLGGFDLQAVLAATAPEARALAGKLAEHVERELLVKLEGELQAAEMEQFLNDYGASVAHRYQFPERMARQLGGELLLLRLPEQLDTAHAIAAMRQDGRVRLAEANHIVHSYGYVEPAQEPGGRTHPEPPGGTSQEPPARTHQEPTARTQQEPVLPDDLHEQQWNLRNTGQTDGKPGADISATQAWTLTTGRQDGPIVAIVDSGVDYRNPELAENLWTNPAETEDGQDNDGNGLVDDLHGGNFITGSGDPMDDSGHGTHIASIIAARGNNGQGMAGINWQGRLMPLKFLERSGRGSIADAIKGLAYAEQQGARITMNGWGTDVQNQALFEVMKASSALHICAAGNDGYDNDTRPIHPASFPLDNVIAVAATDHNDQFIKFSNRGHNSVDLAAPGRKVYSLTLDNEYKLLGGTSTAAAHVAGVAALIASRYPEATNDQIRTRIFSGVDPLPKNSDRVATGGRLNAFKALEEDSVPPASPADLWISQVGAQDVELSWTGTGDDGTTGQATRYELRYASRPIVDGEAREGQVPFKEATPVPTGTPRAPGSAESARIRVSPSGKDRKLYFALRAVDNVGNNSPLATTEALLPAAKVVHEDSFDAPESGWSKEGEWARVPEPGRGLVWTDSPESDYQNDINHSITSQPISLKGVRGAKLHFDTRFTIEPDHDGCHVEVYGKKFWGTRWRKEVTLEGFSDWKNMTVDLSDYDGQEIKMRFRMETDSSRTAYGVQVDNVVITRES
ncbi:MAG: S8 family serine peptidase [Armatimonadetes bacterium]|nr:S8 family serine peptidase [Armatimonadota bacterium]